MDSHRVVQRFLDSRVGALSEKQVEQLLKQLLSETPLALDKTFRSDPLHMIRLVRFQCKYNWEIPTSVIRAVRRNASRIETAPSERIEEELNKIMKLGELRQAIRLMKLMGLLKYVLPEIDAMRGVQQGKKYHQEGDVYKHTLAVLRHAPPTIEGQLAALLHDVGKPVAQQIVGDAINFRGHEDVGAEMAAAILHRLKFDAATIKKIVTVVRYHMRPHSLGPTSTDRALRKFIRDLGDEVMEATLDVAEADEKGSIPQKHNVKVLRERLKRVRETPLPGARKPVLNGNEIMAILGITPRDRARLPEVGAAGKFLITLADEFTERGRELTKSEAERAVRKRFL
jgi:putative nucleotidyltransferase with HDIG domain